MAVQNHYEIIRGGKKIDLGIKRVYTNIIRHNEEVRKLICDKPWLFRSIMRENEEARKIFFG